MSVEYYSKKKVCSFEKRTKKKHVSCKSDKSTLHFEYGQLFRFVGLVTIHLLNECVLEWRVCVRHNVAKNRLRLVQVSHFDSSIESDDINKRITK